MRISGCIVKNFNASVMELYALNLGFTLVDHLYLIYQKFVYYISNLLIMNIKNTSYVLLIVLLFQMPSWAQVMIEGYTFESGNRGFLSQVEIYVNDDKSGEFITSTKSDNDGKFTAEVPPGISSFTIKAVKDLFHEKVMTLGPTDIKDGKAYIKVELQRAPGYIFEITLAEKSDSAGMPTNHLRNSLIEVYNNTTKEPVMVLTDHPQPDFKVDLEKGNHYTVMIRKKGYLAKRMEAFVDVEGCILCFEGIGEVRPGVTDNLSGENSMGTLLANVELERVFEGKSIALPNIYYSYGKANIRKDAADGLQQAGQFLRDNPEITVELGAHTDSRGKSDKNMDLSARRATAAVEYLVKNEEIEQFRITARGYGESDPAIDCGSDCTENQYARNRRTEIKILGVSSKEYKSLEKIKYEENFDAMIAELQSEGQVKVPEDGDIPDDIKKQLEIKENESTIDVDPAKDTEAKMEEAADDLVESVEVEMVDMDKVVPEETTKAMSAIEIAKAEMNATSTEVQSATEAKKEVAKDESNKAVEKASEAVQDEKSSITSEAEATTEDLSSSNSVEGYSGHKIVVAFKRVKITEGDALKEKFADLSVYKAKAGYYLYMTGDYTDKASAEAALENLKSDISSAYIVEFDNGNRVN